MQDFKHGKRRYDCGYDDIKLYFEGIKKGEFECRTVSTSEKNRERYEVRKCYVFNDISWLNDVHEWDGLKSVFAIQRKTTTGNHTADEVSFYISSMEAEPERYLDIVRKHWRIESMHWQLDVVFNEDNCRVLSENGQKTLNIFRKTALALHKTYKEQTGHKKSVKNFMFSCLLNDNELMNVMMLS